MKINTIVVTRNKSMHVKTLHMMLNINMMMLVNKIHNSITFVKDDPFEISKLIKKSLSEYDRIIYIDYGIGVVNEELLTTMIKPIESNFHCMVYPVVKEGINWDVVKKKLDEKSDEPISQMGMEFDTEIGDKIKDCIYKVKTTNPRCYVLDCKHVYKCLNDKKNKFAIPSKHEEMFKFFKERNVKICAYTKARITTYYQYESIGNISRGFGIVRN